MSDVTDDLVLAAEFPAATREQWQRLVAKVLGGVAAGDSPERQLATITADGIEIAPLYVAEASRPSSGLSGAGAFHARADRGRPPRRVGRPAAARAPGPRSRA